MPDVLRMPQAEYEAWLAETQVSIGGTDVGAILGVNVYKTAAQVWDGLLGLSGEAALSPAMRRGVALERIVAEEYERETGRATAPVVAEPMNGYGWTFRQRPAGLAIIHPRLPYAHATPDRLTTGGPAVSGETGMLELKSLGERTFRDTRARGGPEPSYYLQLQWQLACSGLTWGAFAALNAERWELFTIDIPRDGALIQDAEMAVRHFWERHILERRRPAADEPYPSPVPVVVPPAVGGVPRRTDAAWTAAAGALIVAKEGMRLAEHALKLAEERMKALIGDAPGGEGGGVKIHWKEQTARRLNESAAAARVYDREAVRFILEESGHRELVVELDRSATMSDLSRFKQPSVTRPFRVYVNGQGESDA